MILDPRRRWRGDHRPCLHAHLGGEPGEEGLVLPEARLEEGSDHFLLGFEIGEERVVVEQCEDFVIDETTEEIEKGSGLRPLARYCDRTGRCR